MQEIEGADDAIVDKGAKAHKSPQRSKHIAPEPDSPLALVYYDACEGGCRVPGR